MFVDMFGGPRKRVREARGSALPGHRDMPGYIYRYTREY